ncbi:unnamed protein product [Adineta steineri]|uniref:Uncharacterized protein n=1 Tax=Adineta steineri TaxID=433720 RepID=A0A814IQ53_9BILA|nr:unnamed protein product [Adineta steineri]
MLSFYIYLAIFLLKYQVYSVPTCIIIDTNSIQQNEDEISSSSSSNNQSSSSILLRNLRLLNSKYSPTLPDFAIQSVPLSYIDLKQTSLPPLIDIDEAIFKKTLTEPIIERTFSPCTLETLDKLEKQMVIPFEFRRLRIEKPDHNTKYLDEDLHETVPDLSTTVYERRSDPEGVHFCRTCRDGFWTELTVCDTVRCDAELLRANPRLVTDWGEIKPTDGGALYAPSTIFAIYPFAFGPHCKRCESNGQWSRYALSEFCSEIKFFGYSLPSTTTVEKNIPPKIKQTTTTTTTSSIKL